MKYLLNNINQLENIERFWIRAIDNIELVSAYGFNISFDGDKWMSDSYIRLTAGEKCYICLHNGRPERFHVRAWDAADQISRFDIGGDIMSFLYMDYKNQRNIPDYSLSRAFATSDIVHAHEVSFFNVDHIGKCACILMFAGCSKMISSPTLPTTGFQDDSFYEMFAGCKLSIRRKYSNKYNID